MNLKYLFKANFEDGSNFQQTEEDIDSQDPHKSAFTEYLRLCEKRKTTNFFLENESVQYRVNLITGQIFKNGELLYQPEILASQFDLRVIYFRQVQQHKIIPATFHNPQRLFQLETGHLQVTDRLGGSHIFPETSRVEREIVVTENGEDHQYFIYPKTDSTEVRYILGWQTTIETDGKLENIQHSILID